MWGSSVIYALAFSVLTATGAPAADADADAASFARHGAIDMALRDFPRAIAEFSRAIELDPSAKAYHDRAVARLNDRQPILAMADLGDALRLNPAYEPSLMLRGELYLSLHDEARARADFDAALGLPDADPTTRLAVADAYERAGLYEGAIGHFDRWIAEHPKAGQMAEALNGRCWTRAEWGRDLTMALADCDAALKLRPHMPAMLDSRALARLRSGQLDAAIADYNETLKLQPKQAWALYARGVAEQRKGLKAQGDADIAAGRALDPDVPARAKQLGLVPIDAASSAPTAKPAS